jgi:curved DNA-binding protein CbpA
MRDLYECLGVDRNADANSIKRAYRKRAASVHPDVNPGEEDEFRALVLARDILSDPNKRAHYDKSGEIPKQARPQLPAMMLIRQIGAQLAVKDPNGNLLSNIRSAIRKCVSDHESAKASVKTAIANTQIRWKEDETRAEILSQLDAEIRALEANLACYAEALQLLSGSKFEMPPVQNTQVYVTGGGYGGYTWVNG